MTPSARHEVLHLGQPGTSSSIWADSRSGPPEAGSEQGAPSEDQAPPHTHTKVHSRSSPTEAGSEQRHPVYAALEGSANRLDASDGHIKHRDVMTERKVGEERRATVARSGRRRHEHRRPLPRWQHDPMAPEWLPPSRPRLNLSHNDQIRQHHDQIC